MYYYLKVTEDEIRFLTERELTEYRQKEFLLNYRIPRIIRNIKECRDLAEKLNMLDSQEYLDFLDTINELSIDQDRPDTIKGKE